MSDGLPWFPCYPSKLLGAFAAMNPDEGYLYWIVCLRIYEVGGACHDTIDALARRSGMNRRRATAALELSFQAGRLVRQDDGIMNPFAASVMAECTAFRQTRIAAAKKAGLASAKKREQKQQMGPTPGLSDVGQPSTQEQEQEQGVPRGTPRARKRTRTATGAVSDWPVDYQERFWRVYPQKSHSGATEAKLARMRKAAKVPWATMLSGLMRYAAAKTGSTYIMSPLKWLNDGCWDDEYKQEARNGKDRQGRQGGRGLSIHEIGDLLANENRARDAAAGVRRGDGPDDSGSGVERMEAERR